MIIIILLNNYWLLKITIKPLFLLSHISLNSIYTFHKWLVDLISVYVTKADMLVNRTIKWTFFSSGIYMKIELSNPIWGKKQFSKLFQFSQFQTVLLLYVTQSWKSWKFSCWQLPAAINVDCWFDWEFTAPATLLTLKFSCTIPSGGKLFSQLF